MLDGVIVELAFNHLVAVVYEIGAEHIYMIFDTTHIRMEKIQKSCYVQRLDGSVRKICELTRWRWAP